MIELETQKEKLEFAIEKYNKAKGESKILWDGFLCGACMGILIKPESDEVIKLIKEVPNTIRDYDQIIKKANESSS